MSERWMRSDSWTTVRNWASNLSYAVSGGLNALVSSTIFIAAWILNKQLIRNASSFLVAGEKRRHSRGVEAISQRQISCTYESRSASKEEEELGVVSVLEAWSIQWLSSAPRWVDEELAGWCAKEHPGPRTRNAGSDA
jgi:hypothetical protein